MNSPGYCGILLPNPPPTSGAITRSLSSGTPVTIDPMNRTMCGFCVVFQSVSSPVAANVLRDRGARLHGGRNQALLDDVVLDDDLRRRERRVDVAAAHDPVERLVARHARVHLRRAGGHGLLGIDDRRQRLVVDVDQLERILRLVVASRRRPPRRCRRHSARRPPRCRGTRRPSDPRSARAMRRVWASARPLCPCRCRRRGPQAPATRGRCRSTGCARARAGCAAWPRGPGRAA